MGQFKRDISGTNTDYAKTKNDTYADNLETEVLIVGAGFGGIYLMHKLRQLGFRCKIYEAGKNIGGIWHWNCYPGARVDSQIPIYEYSMPEVWKDWTWSCRYPGYEELRKYFDHVDKVLDVRKDVAFQTRVVGAQFDKPSAKWVIKTEDGRTAKAKYFLLATGFAAKRHFPDWMGMDKFKGEIHHSSFWPEGVDVKGKHIAVVGTGSTGVQIAQETSKDAASVTVFQRTPNLALPMQQKPITEDEQIKRKDQYAEAFKYRMTTFCGFQYDFVDRNTFDDTPEVREAFYEERFRLGGFEFWLANYKDLLFDSDANREAYNFWAKKTRARISDPVKRDILAPLEPPHPFGTKRPSLEQNYYEMLDRPENEVVDINMTPIIEFTEIGIKTEDGKHREFNVIALATGFDAVTGGMKNMGLKDVDGIELSEKWKIGTWSYLGMTCAGFPNMFFLYGAHGPTAFSNGPSCIECQGDWIVDAMKKLKDEDIKYIDATRQAEEEWHRKYMSANIPGKPREQLNYAGGIPLYEKECREVLENGFQGFITA
ncbi:cyclopentanone 1,2-monooxygenase [Lojkania enalia]|uniref:Cyclopentanone 1,2-monooxygenase n=1 Tax=Lojkania enalia TaxID=147567 RepID=A0A9P4N377_9PLEO|nr:cyclopentanone 1,2-monooxygenase [Didymosphaeria enalia]